MTFNSHPSGNCGDKILIVEDSPTQAEQLRFMLENNNYRVSVARNGKEALEMMNQVQPGLIISDIVMPELDGYELCRRIKDHDEVCNIRIILLTSLSDPLDVIRGLECGADNFITKPYNEEYLISRIVYLLGNRYEPQVCASLPELKITFAGKEFGITSSRNQILDLLLSTYETAILKNKELIRARDELNALNHQLTAANEELEAFNYMVSHDLCQPLNTVSSACQVIEMLSGDKLDAESKGFLKMANDGVRQMSDLITTLLSFSHSAHSELNRKMVDLGVIARVIAANLRLAGPGEKVKFMIAEGLTADCDPELLKVVLENLLGNACKYAGTHREAIIEFGSLEDVGKTVYFVRDNGPGFSMADAETLFIPFKRLPGTAAFTGHGIGLATVERIIRRHDGKVWAEGEPGNGATFYFTLHP